MNVFVLIGADYWQLAPSSADNMIDLLEGKLESN
jgi:hypothetical protein